MAYRLSQKALQRIGRKIRLARKAQKRKSLDVAVESGVEPSYYSKIENGRARPSLEKIYAICRTLGIKTKDILPF